MTVLLRATFADTLAYGETKLGIPYSEILDGGVGPNFFDCSGLMQNIMRWAGDAAFTRTTYSQIDDKRYQKLGPYFVAGAAPRAQAGWLAYMHVDGEADPGHVGYCLGNGTFLNAPHTGADVRIEAISNTASEHVYAYLVPVYSAVTTVKPPAPVLPSSPQPTAPTSLPTIPMEEDDMIATNEPDEERLKAQIKVWWVTFRTDVCTVDDINACIFAFRTPLANGGWGGSPFSLYSSIIDGTAQHPAPLRPQYAGSV